MVASTTAAPATTPRVTVPVDSSEQLRMNIQWDLNVGERAILDAGADPSDPALRAEVARYFTGDPLVPVRVLSVDHDILSRCHWNGRGIS